MMADLLAEGSDIGCYIAAEKVVTCDASLKYSRLGNRIVTESEE